MEKLERRKSASGSKSSKISVDRRSRTSSGSRKTSSKKTSTDFLLLDDLHKENINYAEEIVLIFYDCLLKGIVEEWKPIVEETLAVRETGEQDVKVKDFKELTTDDLTKSQVVAVKGSQVSLVKKRASSTLSAGKLTPREKSKTKQLAEGADSASVTSKTKRKSSEKAERFKRGSCSATGSTSSATLTTLRSEDIRKGSSKSSREWILKTEDETVIITFSNGNIYEGDIHKRKMHGLGKFWWADGAYYEGDFKNGEIAGRGKMILSDLSYYEGEFCEGLFHGHGVFCVSSSSMVYSGGWKAGRKHGRGWLLYGPNNWYDGEWFEGKRHGFGIRRYISGAVYEGMWQNNIQNGEGSMAWENSDFYNGEWKDGKPHGYGEYTWSAFFNKTLTFPIQNTYQGNWADGRRNGIGLMHFGNQGGGKLAGVWKDNLKHGPGILVCGNGQQLQSDPLFLNDKPIHLELHSSLKTVLAKVTSGFSQDRKGDMKHRRSSLQTVTKQIVSRNSIKKFENVDLKTRVEGHNDKCNPLDIPLHSVPEQVSFDYYIIKALTVVQDWEGSDCETFVFDNALDEIENNKTVSSSRWNILTMTEHSSHFVNVNNKPEATVSVLSFPITSINISKLRYTDFSRYQSEQKQLRHYVVVNLRKLTEIYHRYATICSTHAVDFKPVMVRLYLWQLWRDIGIIDDTTSIYELDLILNENPCSGYETFHCPFEKIYFWQFLQALVGVSWHIFRKRGEPVFKGDGIIANYFKKFLEEYISENRIHVKGLATLIPLLYKLILLCQTTAYSLFEFRDLLPIQDVYRLYCKVGEPHTARDFLKATCTTTVSSEPICYLKRSLTQTAKYSSKRGFNAVPVALSIMFLPEETDEYQPHETIEYEDPFFTDLITFRQLGIKTIMKCLAEVCPQICQDGIVVNINYPLSFLEFHEVLLLCAYKLVDKKQKEKDALEEQARLEEQSEFAEPEHITTAASQKKIRRSSKEKDKKKMKNK